MREAYMCSVVHPPPPPSGIPAEEQTELEAQTVEMKTKYQNQSWGNNLLSTEFE